MTRRIPRPARPLPLLLLLLFLLGPRAGGAEAAEPEAPVGGASAPKIGPEGPPTVGAGGELAAGNRRPAEPERAFHRNELYVDSTDVDQGIVIVDVDPEADTPAIVWHLQEEPMIGEDGAI